MGFGLITARPRRFPTVGKSVREAVRLRLVANKAGTTGFVLSGDLVQIRHRRLLENRPQVRELVSFTGRIGTHVNEHLRRRLTDDVAALLPFAQVLVQQVGVREIRQRRP